MSVRERILTIRLLEKAARYPAYAEGIDKKAEAVKKYGEAAVIEMVIAALPEIAKNVAEPLRKVNKITISALKESDISAIFYAAQE